MVRPTRLASTVPCKDGRSRSSNRYELNSTTPPVNEILEIQLQQYESMVTTETLASIRITEPDGVLDLAIPYVRNTPGESYYLAAYVSSGERWRTRVHMRKTAERPAVFIASGEYAPLNEVS